MDKKLRELRKVFENEPPVSFTDRDKQEVLTKIKQKKKNPSRGTNHILPTVITAVMIVTLLFIFNHQFNFVELGFSNGNKDGDGVRSDILLENVVSEDSEEFRFEQIPWFSTKQELIDSGHIPSDFKDHVTMQSDGESMMFNNNITFKDPQSEAKVIYKFQYDLFIGGEYIIMAKDDDDLVRIGTDLKNKVSERFPKPIQGTLDGLSEDTIRKVRQGHSPGASWWAGDNNFEYSSFEIGIAKTVDGDGIIRLSVRPPKLPEELEKELIEKGLLPPSQEELTEDDIHISANLKHSQSERMAYKDYMLEVVVQKNNDNNNMIYPYIEGLQNITFDENEEEGYLIPNNVGISGDDEQIIIEKLKEEQITDHHTDYQFLGFSLPEEPGNYKMRMYFDAEEDFIPLSNMTLIYIHTENGFLGKKTRSVKLVQIDSEINVQDFSNRDDILTETHETTIELSDELLEIYSQYESSLDDLLLKDLSPIDIFKLYHHANQMDHQEVVYALFIHEEIYGVPDKETYFDDLYSVDNRKYYEELNTVRVFNEVYLWNDQAGVTYTTDSVEYDFFFRLIKDKDTNVWKVSWMPLQ